MENELKNDITELKADLRSVARDMTSINIMQAEIRLDLNHHIKRTDRAEDRIDKLERYFWMAIGALSVLQVVLQISLKVLFK